MKIDKSHVTGGEKVAFEIKKNMFRGSVYGQQGLYIDKDRLRALSAGFEIDEFIEYDKNIPAYVPISKRG